MSTNTPNTPQKTKPVTNQPTKTTAFAPEKGPTPSESSSFAEPHSGLKPYSVGGTPMEIRDDENAGPKPESSQSANPAPLPPSRPVPATEMRPSQKQASAKDAKGAKGESCSRDAFVNVGDTERLVSLALGVDMLTCAATHRGWQGLLSLVMGAGLLLRSVTGHCQLYTMLGMNTACAKSEAKSDKKLAMSTA